jgi:ADP-ribosylation factor 2-binding protein
MQRAASVVDSRALIRCLTVDSTDDEFTALQTAYLDAHCHEFESGDENKLCYTSIFDTYVEQMESFIDRFLSRRIVDFNMESFLMECESRGEEQLCGDAFDVLTSMSDFAAFKELMLAHKQKDQWSVAQNTGPQSPSAKAKPTSDATSSSAAAAAASSNSAPQP